jgi:hypothetical protein
LTGPERGCADRGEDCLEGAGVDQHPQHDVEDA